MWPLQKWHYDNKPNTKFGHDFWTRLMLIVCWKDGRLRSGDHILRIGDTDLHGMGSEQVAQVLRQCGNRVKLVVTRAPVEETPSAVMSVVLPTVSEQQVPKQNKVEFNQKKD